MLVPVSLSAEWPANETLREGADHSLGLGHRVLAGPLGRPGGPPSARAIRGRAASTWSAVETVSEFTRRVKARRDHSAGRARPPGISCLQTRDLYGIGAVEAAFDGADLLGAGGCQGGERQVVRPITAKLVARRIVSISGGWQRRGPAQRTGDPVPSLTRRCKGSRRSTAGCRKCCIAATTGGK